MANLIASVAIVGGTHGNELTGVHLLNRWARVPAEVARATFRTQLIIANPEAVSVCRRYVDEDLNRCFSHETLRTIGSTAYEVNRAIALNQVIGPKGSPQFDFLIDLHTSTSECGSLVILCNDNEFNLKLAAYISSRVSGTHIYHIPPEAGESPFLISVCSQAVAIEVGPISHGMLRSDIFSRTNDLVAHALDYVHMRNLGSEPAVPDSVEMFRFRGEIIFPKDGLHFSGMIHEALQGRSFEPLQQGDPLFRMFNGDVIEYEGETVYPVFINEAAYYHRGVALTVADKVEVVLF